MCFLKFFVWFDSFLFIVLFICFFVVYLGKIHFCFVYRGFISFVCKLRCMWVGVFTIMGAIKCVTGS
jgi:hypothetical protein